MRHLTTIVAIAALAGLVPAATQAQEAGRFSLDLRSGAVLPTADLGASALNPGMGLGLVANLQVMPHLNLYAGWDWARFTLEQDLGPFEDMDVTGYSFGARFFAPSLGSVTPWLRAGGVYDHIELEGDDRDDRVSADHTLGWEAGVGAAVPLGGRWALLPGVSYRSFSPELDEIGGKAYVRYLTIDIGISATFGGPSMAAVRHR
ncbi:MAG TPA: outer membrane beta-barrel protein [Longimicrobiales bacterium]|nr:outer membrane beta-barrel protein [Longimicrobiales bacterium]